MAGNKPISIWSRRWTLEHHTVRQLKGRKHRAEFMHDDCRDPVPVRCSVAAEQQELSNPCQLDVPECEPMDGRAVGERLIQRNRSIQIVDEYASKHVYDVLHARTNVKTPSGYSIGGAGRDPSDIKGVMAARGVLVWRGHSDKWCQW